MKCINPRFWSNAELKKFSSLFGGDIINVSGWKDEDKEGDFYKNYFKKTNNYFLSNYPKDNVRGATDSDKTDFFIDLEKDLPKELIGRFDVVFNHTVLEHVKNPVKVFKNLSLMTKDILIIVVPFKQKLHFSHGNYGDYFRFSPMAMRDMFKENGFYILYENYTPYPAIDVYLFYLGTKNRQKWENKTLRNTLNLEQLNGIMGMNNVITLLHNILVNIKMKLKRVLKIK